MLLPGTRGCVLPTFDKCFCVHFSPSDYYYFKTFIKEVAHVFFRLVRMSQLRHQSCSQIML